jgi:hypothetical protein
MDETAAKPSLPFGDDWVHSLSPLSSSVASCAAHPVSIATSWLPNMPAPIGWPAFHPAAS